MNIPFFPSIPTMVCVPRKGHGWRAYGGCVFFAMAFFSLMMASVVSAGDLKIKFTDTSRVTYEGDWLTISYQAYTSKTVGSGKRKGTLTCKPNVFGTYQIIAEYKSTENRGNRAQYYVDGKKAKEIDQSGGNGTFEKASLGVFALTPESTVELRAQDGKSYSFVSFTFTTSTETPSDSGNSDTPSGGDSGSGASPAKDYTAASDGEMTIQPFLSTNNSAELRVFVEGKEILAWVRTNGTTKELCVFQGKPDEKSMFERKPGDFSPASGLKYTYALKAGQKGSVVKKGNYESGTFLKVDGPFDTASLSDLLKKK